MAQLNKTLSLALYGGVREPPGTPPPPP
eukprot:SAG25_NODE_2491_length_1572_cov_5.468432_3_plen_27_part_01